MVGDSRKILPFLLSFLFMLIKAVNNLLYLSVLTIFLEKAGANSLPWVYLSVNVCFIFIQFNFITRIAGYEGHWLLGKVSLPMILMSFSAAMFLPTEMTLVLIVFLAAAMLSDLVSNQAFTAMLNHFLSLNESKRILPFVYAAGSLGYILSGLTLKFVIDIAGFKGLLLLNGMIASIGYLIIQRLRPYEIERLENAEEDEIVNSNSDEGKVETSIKHPLARLLIFSSFLIIFNRYLIDFLFAAAISSYFISGKDIASFMGIFGATADLLVIGLQTFVMKAVFSSLPVGRVLTIVPAILTFLCIAASIDMRFAVVASIQFLVMVNSKNFTVPATTLLMGVIPQRKRVIYRRDISVACAVASTGVGLFLLIIRDRLEPSTMFIIAAFVYLALTVIHFLLDKAYLLTLKSQIVSQEYHGVEEQLTSVRYLRQQDRIEQLKLLLENGDLPTRIAAIKEVGELTTQSACEILYEQLKKEAESRCIAETARVLLRVTGAQAFNKIEELLAETADLRLKADLIEAIGRLPGAGEETVAKYLDHPHHRIRASAIISLLRIARDRNRLEAALLNLSEMVKDHAEMMRASAAAIMGEVGLPLFLPCLEMLAFENNSAVAVSALNAISRIQSPLSLACLERLKNHQIENVAKTARRLAENSVRQNVGQIGRLLTSITAEERLLLASRVRQIGDDDSLELLSLILCVEEVALRKRLIGFFEKADPETLDLLSRCLILGREEKVSFTLAPAFSLAIDEFYQTLPHWIELFRAIGAGALENQDSVHYRPLKHFLRVVWAENIAAANISLTESQLQIVRKRTRIACELACCLASEPVALLNSLEKSLSGSPYARSLAEEYIETRIGRSTAEFILPLLKTCLENESDPDELVRKADEFGVEITASLIESAESRLKNNLPRLFKEVVQ
jgi:hypothetical protein